METVGRGRDRDEGLVPRRHGCRRENRDERLLRISQVEKRSFRKAGPQNLEREPAVTLSPTLSMCILQILLQIPEPETKNTKLGGKDYAEFKQKTTFNATIDRNIQVDIKP